MASEALRTSKGIFGGWQGCVRQGPKLRLFLLIPAGHFQYTQGHTQTYLGCPWRSAKQQGPNDDHTMAGMNGTRVSAVIFATSFLLGASCNRLSSFNTSDHVHNPQGYCSRIG